MLSLCALETVSADLGIAVEFGAAEAAAYRAYASIPNRVQSLRAVAAQQRAPRMTAPVLCGPRVRLG